MISNPSLHRTSTYYTPPAFDGVFQDTTPSIVQVETTSGLCRRFALPAGTYFSAASNPRSARFDFRQARHTQ
jgi:hypothetical protein